MPDYRLGRLKGQFVVVWEDERGRRRRYRLGTRDPREARTRLQAFLAQLSRGHAGQTIAEIWDAYVAEKAAEGLPSVPRMRDAWKRLGPVFGGLHPNSLESGEIVRDYTTRRRASGAGDGTIHTELLYLRAALRRALKQAAPAVTLPSKPRPRARHLSPDEARRLIDAAQVPHVRWFILLALHTAGRPSSILDLAWDRVDLTKGLVSLDNPRRDRTAKGRATVPIGPALIAELCAARRAALTEHVIEWAGKPIRSIKRAIERTAERAGLEGVTAYVLRHTAAVWMAEGGVPMSEISQYLGHTSTAVTERVYARFSPEYLRRAANAISRRLTE